jgi:hypothetical protein
MPDAFLLGRRHVMRALIVSTLMTLGLTGGVAAADNYRGDAHRETVRDHREVPVYRVDHDRDYRARPAPRFERHDERRGCRWRVELEPRPVDLGAGPLRSHRDLVMSPGRRRARRCAGFAGIVSVQNASTLCAQAQSVRTFGAALTTWSAHRC